MAPAISERTRRERTAGVQQEAHTRPQAEAGVVTHITELQRMTPAEVVEMAHADGLTDTAGMTKQQLIFEIVRVRGERGETIRGGGTLEVLPDGFGFLRLPERNYASSLDDIYVSRSQIQKLALQSGMTVEGVVRPPSPGRQNFALLRVEWVNDEEPAKIGERLAFDDLTPLHPTERLILETDPQELNMRVVDLVTPVGKGQRGLIVSPPRAGKTVLLQKIASSVQRNDPRCYVIVLLVDERPEEVTDVQRNVAGPATEVVSSTFDAPPESHVHLAELVLEKAKRLVECGRDVVILLDSITRLARAYNSLAPAGGKIMTGGVSVGALEKPKRFFGAARNVEEGGSLTILATALVDTGSKMDEVIFEEFKGTGNMELQLDRRLVDRRVWPAIDINASGTRREELLLDQEELRRVWLLRKTLSDLSPVDAMELLVNRLAKTRTNAEFLMSMRLD